MKIKCPDGIEVIDNIEGLSETQFRRYINVCNHAIKTIDQRIETEDMLKESGREWLGEEWRDRAIRSRESYKINMEELEFRMREKFGYDPGIAERFYEVAKEMLDKSTFDQIFAVIEQ
jgi:hypothetical protein